MNLIIPMNWIFISLLSVICVASMIFLSHHISQESLAQISVQQTKSNAKGAQDVFRVGITVIGITNETGNVFSFVKVNQLTAARYFNASQDDLKDHDGIVDSVLSFPNQTVGTGANFTACNVVLMDLAMSCKSGINIPQRTEILQFVLPTFKPTVK